MASTSTIIDCLRHGEVDGGSRFRGVSDDALTELGWQQMERQCSRRHWDAVISSPLRRCRDFAEAWADQHGLPLQIEPAWSEINFGAWEGLSAEQIEQRFPGCLSTFYADPIHFSPPDAEPYQEFARRIQLAWEQALTRHAGQRLLVLTHGGPIRALWSELMMISPQNSFRIDVPHACMTRFSCFQDADNRFVQLNFHQPL